VAAREAERVLGRGADAQDAAQEALARAWRRAHTCAERARPAPWVRAIAQRMYGADGVDFSADARRQINQYTEWGLAHLPVCIAKTNYSLSADAGKRGRPTGFRVSVREVRPAAGAGFLIAYLGEIRTMPGLPSTPSAGNVDIDDHGRVKGLF